MNEIAPIAIEHELKQSYLDYAMSVIVGRALPDVRDGLKPVHRRVLFAMRELGNDWNKAYKKSARVVGDVIGKYHPHGDTAVYDTIVRMAQPFSLRYMLVDGQGNFGSVDGDSPAAMRYTEVRMSRLAHYLLTDLEKETVDFVPNYDETEWIPAVLPTRVPNLLVNGSSGIAVGMATNIPPHNLNEVVNACLALIDEPTLEIDDLIQYIPGPDFPTAAIIMGRAGIMEAYRTGRGRVHIRARTEIETNEKNGKDSIIIHELPYQVNKARLVEKIAELVREKQIEGITELRDESDKDGMRVVIELRKGEMTDVVLNNLFIHTQMQVVFGINMVALEDNQPKLMNLKQVLQAFIRHRQEVVTRRTIFELRKARERAHILEGLSIALANIDEMIAIIKASSSPGIAKEKLLGKDWVPGIVKAMLSRVEDSACRLEGLPVEYGLHGETYKLSGAQVDAILELRLHRLTGLEQDKIFAEYEELLKQIAYLLAILGDVKRLMEIIRGELVEIKEQFGDARRTEITHSQHDFSIEDLIAEEDMVVTLSSTGYVKAQPVSMYQAQHRGGRGKAAASVKEEDFIERLAVSSTHATMLCFSSMGKVYWKKVYEFPQASRTSRGRPIVNLLPLQEGERITAMLPVREYDENHFVFMATAKGTVKKTTLEQFSRPRANGIIAVDLEEGDQLIGVELTDGKKEIMMFSDEGKAVRFIETDVRPMGRNAHGVRGIRLQENQKVISLIALEEGESGTILTATERGYGKRTEVAEYRKTNRGAQGVTSIQTSERNGNVVSAALVKPTDEVLLISDGGTLVRTRVDEISVIGRNTQGVRLIRLDEKEKLIGVQRVDELPEVVASEDVPVAEATEVGVTSKGGAFNAESGSAAVKGEGGSEQGTEHDEG